MTQIISLEQAREGLGKIGKKMTDSQIEKLVRNLYQLINLILDNNISYFAPCKR